MTSQKTLKLSEAQEDMLSKLLYVHTAKTGWTGRDEDEPHHRGGCYRYEGHRYGPTAMVLFRHKLVVGRTIDNPPGYFSRENVYITLTHKGLALASELGEN